MNALQKYCEKHDRKYMKICTDCDKENAAKDKVIEAARRVADAGNVAAWSIETNELRKRLAELDALKAGAG